MSTVVYFSQYFCNGAEKGCTVYSVQCTVHSVQCTVYCKYVHNDPLLSLWHSVTF